jgi:3-dehydroquinate synthase
VDVRTLTVEGACGVTYPVVIGEGLLSGALPRFVDEGRYSGVVIVTNDTVGPLYGEALATRITGSALIVLPDGEEYKTLDSLRRIYDELLAAGADRGTLIVALGGGVIGDLAGFAAATFMRGAPFVQAPTTLLAMVDASIGGKTGVDLPQGKNLAGAFYDPRAVYADVTALNTLPVVEYESGMAELIKHGLLGAPALLDAVADGDPPDVAAIARAVKVKVDVVGQDRTEQGVRAVLNLGHTFGHALEVLSGYALKHGYAVAVGMTGAARLSARLGLCDESLIGRVESILGAWNLPTRYEGFAPERVWEAMQVDKKWRGGESRFVLLEGVGKPVIQTGVPRDDVLAVLADVRGN